MIDLDALRWPDADVRGKKAIIPEAREAVPFFLQYVEGRRGVIQAGGNVGVYPLLLAEQFERVATLEPEPENLRCLLANVAGRSNITAGPFALAAECGRRLRLNVTEPDNCGAHQFMPPIGDEPTAETITIDALAVFMPPIDLIWLDVEGAELPAIKGAQATIQRHSPAIIVEEKGHGKLFGYTDEEMRRVLAGLGYELQAQHHNDRLYTR